MLSYLRVARRAHFLNKPQLYGQFQLTQKRTKFFNPYKARVKQAEAKERKAELETRIGEAIIAEHGLDQVGVVDIDGTFLGTMPTSEAIQLARTRSLEKEEKLELTLLTTSPPVCRFQSKKQFLKGSIMRDGLKEKIKEHKISDTINERDLQMKVRFIRQHLIERHRVKLSVVFKSYKNRDQGWANAVLENVKSRVSDLIVVNRSVCQEEKREFFILFYPSVKALEKREALGIEEPKEGDIQFEAKTAAFFQHEMARLERLEKKKTKKLAAQEGGASTEPPKAIERKKEKRNEREDDDDYSEDSDFDEKE